jgi:hypothetical protein
LESVCLDRLARQTPLVHSLGDMAKALNRSAVVLHGLQTRFELPAFEGAGYSTAYLAFLRTVIALRTLNIAEDTLRNLWRLEKKLLQLLHVDSTGSPTWFLDSCGSTSHPDRRLLLTNHDLGIPLTTSEVQTGLNFSNKLPELFPGGDMGEDALRVLRDCLKHRDRIHTDIAAELPHLRATLKWAASLRTKNSQPNH